MNETSHNVHKHVTAAGLLVTLGIIFGDIGTSPLYVLKAIVGDAPINKDVVLGGVSCIFWTLTLQTTIKYVLITLNADNKGEGGIFALYTLVRRTKVKWLLFPALIGGAAILAEGIITPPISVSSAIEGLRMIPALANIKTVPIVLTIITLLFVIQQFGTKSIGKMFGPIMLVWFSMLGILGFKELMEIPEVFKAVNPYYAYQLLVNTPHGFWLLGAVFLCTTGAEALYSDLGHCGKQNIRVSWIFVKTMLLLNYFGQAAYLIKLQGTTLQGSNPFFAIMPNWFLPIGIIIATLATIVASQALISGSFTLVNEAVRLNFWPKVKIKYPTEVRGQLYLPAINWMLYVGCVLIVLYFKESSAMEAAYGLTIITGMLMSSRLLTYYMRIKHYPVLFIWSFVVIYLLVELSFFVANLEKFPNGGWISMFIAFVLFSMMWIWQKARQIKSSYVEYTKINNYLDVIKDLSHDLSIPKFATHLVYLTSGSKPDEVESKALYSILQKQPKRADIYWFVHVDVVDYPNTMEYKVTTLLPGEVIRVDFRLGFRVEPRINLFFRKVVQDLVRSKEIDILSRYESLNRNNVIGDFKFVVIEKFLSNDNELPPFQKIILDIYFFIKQFSLSEEKAFGLDTSNVLIEKFPLVISAARKVELKRVMD